MPARCRSGPACRWCCAWAVATLFVGAFAAALGAIILRLRGHYFAIGSIGVVEVVRLVVSSWGSLTGGGDGLNLPLLSGGPNAVGPDLPARDDR